MSLPLMFATLLLASPALCEGRIHSHHQHFQADASAPAVPVVAKKVRPEFMPNVLAKLAEQCQCQFQGICTCEGSMDFMDCISEACAAGTCDCHNQQYHKGCVDMAMTCPSLDFDCTSNRAVCTVEVRTVDGREVKEETPEQILDDLAAMKEKKCRLEKANEDGWLNADRRLEELKPYIEERLEALQSKSSNSTNFAKPWMGCGDEPPNGPHHAEPRKLGKDKSATTAGFGTMRVVILSCATLFAWVSF